MPSVNENKIKSVINNVDGWLTYKEGLFLYKNALKSKGTIVEIGSWKGKSTICLGLGAKNTTIYAIDPHTGSNEDKKTKTFKDFIKNIKLYVVEDKVIPIVKKSEYVVKNWTKKIDFLWIDGSHEYSDVKKDILLWEKHLTVGGLIALHDTVFQRGPKVAARRFIIKARNFSNIGFVDNITFAKKTNKLTIRNKIEKQYKYYLKICLDFLMKIQLKWFRSFLKFIFYSKHY